MNTWEQRLRRNFFVVAIIHVGLIGALVIGEAVASRFSRPPPAPPAFIVADLLGDLPKGPGIGRGAYAPARPAPPSAEPAGGVPSGAPNDAAMSADEEVAPAPKAHAAPADDPNEISVSKKDADRAKKKPAVATKVPAARTAPTATAAKPAKAIAKPGAGLDHSAASHGQRPGAHGTAVASAADIRNRFASALAAAEGGTPYGDGRPGGGGSGKSPVIGSPDGSPFGEAGGVGKGTPFWWYYQHVHDKMYEAWEQPGQAVNWDRRLMTTVMIRVTRDGKIVETWIKDPSGNKLMDDSALAATRRVQRLEPLPDGLGGVTADISVAFQLES